MRYLHQQVLPRNKTRAHRQIMSSSHFSFSHFGAGTGGILLDNLGCSGFESRLLDCSHPTIGIHNCDHNADAGVRCQGRVWIALLD